MSEIPMASITQEEWSAIKSNFTSELMEGTWCNTASVRDASPTQMYSFLPASWVGDTHKETDILPIGSQEEMGWATTRPSYWQPKAMQVLMLKNLPMRIFLRGEGRGNRSGLLAKTKTRTSLRLVVHVGTVFICPGYAHGPSGRSC